MRGAHRSKPIEDLVKEAQGLAHNGVKELIIIAQDSTYYGLDLYKKRRLADLLLALTKVEGIEWIRLHYAFPSGFPEDVLGVIATEPKVCSYIDIPLTAHFRSSFEVHASWYNAGKNNGFAQAF
jgi:ribosomal protein S12 methylthiotransferase